jgi:predicted Fe-S protein YdhL (DUF1289 family)
MTEAIPSPCILVCQLDHRTGWCLGCGRSSDEIMDWPAAPDDLKHLILGALPQRLEALGLPSAGDPQEAERRAAAQRLTVSQG